MTTIWDNNNSYSAESRANEISEKTGYSDPECMLCGRVMHNSFEQNDDKESIKNAIARHYEDYHADIKENFKFIDIEIKKQLAKTGRDMGGGSNSQEGSMQPEAYTWFKSLPKNEQIELLSGQGYAQGPDSFKDIDNSQIGVGGEIDLLIENIYYSKFLGKDPQAISYGDKNEYPIDEDNYYDSDRQKIRTSMRDSYVDADGVTRQNESYANESAENWWNQLEVDSQTQVLIASQVDERHAGLSWINLGHENQQKIIMEYGNDPEIITDNPIMNARDELSESGQVDNDPNWKSGRFRRGGSWADKKDAWDKSQGEALPPTDANEEELLNNYSDNVDQSKKTNEDFDSYNLGNPKDDLPKHRTVDDRIEDTQEAKEVGCDQCDGSGFIHDEGGRTKEERSACKNCDGKGFVERGGLFKEVKGDYVVYDGEDYSVEDTTRNEEEPTEDRAGKLMRDQKATSNFWEDTQKSKVPQGQGHKWQKHGEQDDRPEDSHVTVDLSDKKTHDDLDDEFWKGIRESKTNEIFDDLEEVTELDDSEKDEVFEFLFDLRESGKTNMFGAGRYVQEEFGFEKKLTDNIVQEWMKNFKELSRRMGRESRTSSLFDPSEFSNEESDTEINPMGDSEKDEIFQYLFELQSSGVTNMFGAVPYAVEEFPQFDKKEVKAVVMEWMKNYSEIHDRMGIDFV